MTLPFENMEIKGNIRKEAKFSPNVWPALDMTAAKIFSDFFWRERLVVSRKS